MATPLRREQAPSVTEDRDEALWFFGFCGERDFLLGKSHTFTGRMTAWCPKGEVGYSVSSSEMTEMSLESRYFVRGFLQGAEPGPPYDDDGEIAGGDLQAWRQVVARFRRTGGWYGRWGTCWACGSVLLPDAAVDRCEIHQEQAGGLDD